MLSLYSLTTKKRGQDWKFQLNHFPSKQELHVHPKAAKGDKNQVGAPMPGTVIDIRVKVGDSVEKGAALVVLSAMKMEMVVQAPKAGKIKTLDVTQGMRLEGDDLVLTLE